MIEVQCAEEKLQELRYKVGEREMRRTIQVMNFGGTIEKLATDFWNERIWN